MDCEVLFWPWRGGEDLHGWLSRGEIYTDDLWFAMRLISLRRFRVCGGWRKN